MAKFFLSSFPRHRILSHLLQAAVAIVRKRPLEEEDRSVHKADLLEEMIVQGHFPLECGMKFSEILHLADQRELLQQLEGDEAGYIELLWT
jgi:hypothetical protein